MSAFLTTPFTDVDMSSRCANYTALQTTADVLLNMSAGQLTNWRRFRYFSHVSVSFFIEPDPPPTVFVEHMAEELSRMISQLRANVDRLVKTVREENGKLNPDDVIAVPRREMEKLVTEVMQMKEFLPKITGRRHCRAFTKWKEGEQELQFRRSQVLSMQSEKKQTENRIDRLQCELEKQKEENFSAKFEASELKEQLSQQSIFCSSVGASTCTLLWRLSRIESSIDTILSGTTAEPFFDMVVDTMASCVAAYPDKLPDDQSNEAQFILSVCGTVTNIAASAVGRDFLASSSSGQKVLNSLINTLANVAPNGKTSSQLKNLILMGLYNVSINQKGLTFLTSREDLMQILGWQLQGSNSAENVTNCLRLLQSLLMEPKSQSYAQKALEAIPTNLLESLSNDRNPEVRSAALELLSDIQSVPAEE